MKNSEKDLSVVGDPRDDYDDGNIPAIDLPQDEETIEIPDNRPSRPGPGGE